MGFYFMIATAASASLDALFTGLAIGADGKKGTQRKIFGITCVITATCALAYLSAEAVQLIIGDMAVKISGAILVTVGLADAICARASTETPVFVRNRRENLFQAVILPGIGIGLDGACATASLALAGYGFFCAIAVSALHYIFIELGTALAGVTLPRAIKNSLAPSILITLGLFKLLSF